MPDNLRDKFHTLEGEFFGAYHKQVEKNRRFYKLDFKSEVDPANQMNFVFVATTAAQSIDEAVDHVLFRPRIKVPVRPTKRQSTHEQDNAELKRNFMKAWWHNVEVMYNPIGDGRKDLINEGKIALKHEIKWELIPDFPGPDATKAEKTKFRKALNKMGADEFLWRITLLDNLTVFEDPSDHRNPQYVFLAFDILVERAKFLYPDSSGEWRGKQDLETVKFIEYWSLPEDDEPGRFVQWVENEVVHDEDSPYPYIPIIIEDAGFGNVRAGAKIEDKFVGMTQKMHDVFVAESRQYTSMENVAELTAFPVTTTRNMEPGRKIHVGPGVVIPLDGDEGAPGAEMITIVEGVEVPLTVLQVIDRTIQMANSTLKNQTLGGIPTPGVETASEADQQLRNASTKLSGIIDGLARLVVRCNALTFIDVDVVLEAAVTVQGSVEGAAEVKLGPGNIKGFYVTDVEFRTSDEDALAQLKARFWGEMYNNIPFLSAFTAMERGEISDEPMAEMVRRAAEDVFLSPEMATLRLVTGAESMGQLLQMLKQIAAEGQAEGGGQNAPLASEETANAEPNVVTPVEQQALQNRDVTQAGRQIGAPRG